MGIENSSIAATVFNVVLRQCLSLYSSVIIMLSLVYYVYRFCFTNIVFKMLY